MVTIDHPLLQGKRIKRFEIIAKMDGEWYDVLSVNKKKKTIYLYNMYGSYITELSNLDELKRP